MNGKGEIKKIKVPSGTVTIYTAALDAWCKGKTGKGATKKRGTP